MTTIKKISYVMHKQYKRKIITYLNEFCFNLTMQYAAFKHKTNKILFVK